MYFSQLWCSITLISSESTSAVQGAHAEQQRLMCYLLSMQVTEAGANLKIAAFKVGSKAAAAAVANSASVDSAGEAAAGLSGVSVNLRHDVEVISNFTVGSCTGE